MTPVNVSGTLIYFRGRYIMDGILQDLIANHGLEQASDLVVKGCSAGGLAAYLHADYIRSRLPETVRVVAMPGAGFFLDIPALNVSFRSGVRGAQACTLRLRGMNGVASAQPYRCYLACLLYCRPSPHRMPTLFLVFAPLGVQGQYLYTPHYQYVFTMQNVSGSVNSACIAAYNASEQWRCFMAEYTLPHMQVPVFASNALWDSWQAGNIMGLGCDPAHAGSCNAAQLAYVADFRTAMIQRLGPIFANPRNGAFLQTCFVHVVEDIDVSWHNTTVAGQTQSETFWSWYSGGTALSRTAVDGPSVNPTCYGN